MLRTSGTAAAPIVFGSYGTGRATISNSSGAVWFAGKHHLVFENLTLTTGGSANSVFAGSASAGSTDITLRDSVVERTAGVGIIAPTAADQRWSIVRNTVRATGDSGMILLSPETVVDGNTIHDAGRNLSISYAKHGIYAKARDLTISNNDIYDIPEGQAVSIRFHGARVFGNRIHDTGYALAFFDYDPAPAPKGPSWIYSNRFWNVSGYAFYYGGQNDPNGVAPSVDFVIASNTFVLNGGEAINVSESGSAKVTVANNVFTGSYGSALRRAATTVAHHNVWHGAGWNVPTGNNNTTVAPALSAAPTLAPLAGSPVVDAGTATVTTLSYAPTCTAAPLAYCAAAPELGAVEAGGVAALAPPTALSAVSATQTSVALAWTASTDARVVSYRVYRDGAAVATTTGTVATADGLSCGQSYVFTVRGADSGGNLSAAASLTTTTAACTAPAPAPAPAPDTTAPYVVFASPKPGATVPLSFTATVTATDAGGVADVTFYRGSTQVCVDTAAPYTCAYALTVGTHRLQARATDRSGNRGWVSISVTASRKVRSVSSVSAAGTTRATAPKTAAARARAARAAKLRAAKARTAKARAAKLRAQRAATRRG